MSIPPETPFKFDEAVTDIFDDWDGERISRDETLRRMDNSKSKYETIVPEDLRREEDMIFYEVHREMISLNRHHIGP